MRAGFYLLTALAAAGAWASELLVRKHVAYKWAGAADTGICEGAHVSCEEAAKSVMAEIGGLPVAALGLAFYVVVLLLAAAWRFAEERFPKTPDVLLIATALSVLYSAVLDVYTITALERFCPLCLVLYGVNAGLFATVFITHPNRKDGAIRPFAGLVKAPAAWLALGLMVFATIASQGVYATQARAAAKTAKPAPKLAAKPLDVKVGDAPGKGPADAPVVIVEFSDFECPHCQRLADNLREAAKKAPDAFRYHFKHYPMDQACNVNIGRPFHRNACGAALAAECARQQGRFWPLHDAMFENRALLSPQKVTELARAAGIDLDRWNACMNDPASMERVKADIAQGRALGVGGTPTFFVNGFKQVGGLPPSSLLSLVEQAKTAKAARDEKAAN